MGCIIWCHLINLQACSINLQSIANIVNKLDGERWYNQKLHKLNKAIRKRKLKRHIYGENVFGYTSAFMKSIFLNITYKKLIFGHSSLKHFFRSQNMWFLRFSSNICLKNKRKTLFEYCIQTLELFLF